ncbi:MAG: Ribosomal protein methyltransferase [Chlamydiales bacterium]|jgi:ribosomal protein L11 methyltransferase|nr:Ribosomal protein methyltransferase [Chlamydiales bacterium]
MMIHIVVYGNYSVSYKKILNLLEYYNAQNSYIVESPQEKSWEIHTWAPSKDIFDEFKEKFPQIVICEAENNAAIDWEAQWQAFSPYYKNGTVSFPLASLLPDSKELNFSLPKLQLIPGEGFGDLSHPTTSLTLELMASEVQDKVVIDLGTGSGVLAIAAIGLGAKKIIAIDIEPEALKHASKNLELNGITEQVELKLPYQIDWPIQGAYCAVMNMLPHEQKEAYASLPDFVKEQIYDWIISGIIVDQKENYLELAQQWGWQLYKESFKEGWWGFHFKMRT